MDTKKKKSGLIIFSIIIAVAIIVVIFLMIILGGKRTDDIRITGGGSSISLKCTDSRLLHPALRDRTPVSHTNMITATFVDNVLSTISLYYTGIYNTPEEAKQAEAYAQADYGLIPAKEMNIDVESFSHSFMTDDNKVSMTITAKNDDVDDKTAPYFLLEQGKSFPRSISSMKERYEGLEFSCKIID